MKMKAAVFYDANSPLKIEEVNRPKPSANEVLLTVRICGICHTDLSMFKGLIIPRKKPVIFGHEISGDIEDVGEGVSKFGKGDRVIVSSVISCGRCYYCSAGRENLCKQSKTIGIDIDGGYAEYISVPEDNVFNLPNNISYEEGSLIGDVLATAYHAVQRSRVCAGESVIIYGAGALGMCAVQIVSNLIGAKAIVVDIFDMKLKLAKELGAHEVINSGKENPVKRALEITGGMGVDCAMEFVGIPVTYQQAIDSVRRGGRVMLVGATAEKFEVSPRRFFKDEVEVTGAYSTLKSKVPELIELVEKGKIKLRKLLTHTISLDEINYGMEILEKGIENPIKVLIKN